MNDDITAAISLLEEAKAAAKPKDAVPLIHKAITTLIQALSTSHGSGNTEDHTN